MHLCNEQTLLPDNATRLELNIESVMQQKYCGLDSNIIKQLFDPQTCPTKFLPWLAYAESIDIWDDNWSEQTKRDVIASGIETHKHKGFYAAVAQAIASLGISNVQLIDWLDDEDNIPLGCFRVELDANDTAINRGQNQFNLVRAINTTKRLSAHYSIIIKDQLDIKPHVMLGGLVTIRDKSGIQASANLMINKTISTKLLNVIYTR